ncbi:hypothetical protein HBI37_142650 [Parastagonospora nodorum]|nr:hypothetical protein HBH50_084230 [Parastagonospora nodorum]KAH4984222.1 hypothetical protein HBI76_140900 [Parastagonospora nodorum]KAH5031090.1 hypothetical protein HBI74_086130 [Parastagonospora nodorum]KAH6171571.1 hypothetical protein HBI61_178170 [Parastagonospora nodorum]KAH6335996.1 hypothetical protein HBI37_142650 [Parastagonospora nodorum]
MESRSLSLHKYPLVLCQFSSRATLFGKELAPQICPGEKARWRRTKEGYHFSEVGPASICLELRILADVDAVRPRDVQDDFWCSIDIRLNIFTVLRPVVKPIICREQNVPFFNVSMRDMACCVQKIQGLEKALEHKGHDRANRLGIYEELESDMPTFSVMEIEPSYAIQKERIQHTSYPALATHTENFANPNGIVSRRDVVGKGLLLDLPIYGKRDEIIVAEDKWLPRAAEKRPPRAFDKRHNCSYSRPGLRKRSNTTLIKIGERIYRLDATKLDPQCLAGTVVFSPLSIPNNWAIVFLIWILWYSVVKSLKSGSHAQLHADTAHGFRLRHSRKSRWPTLGAVNLQPSNELLYADNPLYCALLKLESMSPTSRLIDTLRLILSDYDSIDEWLWINAALTFDSQDLVTFRMAMLHGLMHFSFSDDHAWHHEVIKWLARLMDSDMIQQYSEVYPLLDPELFVTTDSFGSALSLHGYLVLLVELGVDVETCIHRHDDILLNFGMPPRRVVFEKHEDDTPILRWEWLYDPSQTTSYLIVTEFTSLAGDACLSFYKREWPFINCEHDWEGSRSVEFSRKIYQSETAKQIARFERRMNSRERKERSRKGQKRVRSRMPGAWI